MFLFRRRQWHPTPVLLPGKSHGWRSLVGCSPWGRWGSETTEQLHFHFSLSLEKEMATHSSVLAWRIPGTGEPGGLPSMGSHRVGHGWSDLAAAETIEGRDLSFKFRGFKLSDYGLYLTHSSAFWIYTIMCFLNLYLNAFKRNMNSPVSYFCLAVLYLACFAHLSSCPDPLGLPGLLRW